LRESTPNAGSRQCHPYAARASRPTFDFHLLPPDRDRIASPARRAVARAGTASVRLASQYGAPAAVSLQGIDAKTTAQLGDRQSLVAAFNSSASSATALTPRLNTSLFDMHYSMMLSPSAFFTVNVTRNGARIEQ